MGNYLVIVDVQNDFCEGGALAVPGGNRVAQDIMRHVAAYHVIFDAIYVTQDWHIDPGDHWSADPDFVDSWPVHCEAGTPGAELHPAIQAVEGVITSKHFKGLYSAAYSGDEAVIPMTFDHNARIYVCGLALDYCVYQTALDLDVEGGNRKVHIIERLSAAINEENVKKQKNERHGIRYV